MFRFDKKLVELADAYGISIVDKIDKDSPTFAPGPSLGGVDVASRSCFFEVCMGNPSFHRALHEIVHLIVLVPTRDPLRGIENVDEGDLLMPYERAVARCLGVSRAKIDRVIGWQEETLVWIDDMTLGDFRKYESHPRWRRGVRILQEIGLLDRHERPTFKREDWSSTRYANRRWLISGVP